MKIVSNLDVNYNQLQNALMHPTATAPANPQEGQMYFNTTGGNKKLFYYNGTTWVQLIADIDNYVSSLNFSTVTGVLTIGRTGGLADLTANLDGRYLTGHPTIAAAVSVNNSGRTYIQDITLDANGHITGIVSATEVDQAEKYPTTFTWSGGTTAGPTGFLTGVNLTPVAYPAIPSATEATSGIVTTGAQTFAGDKTFNNNLIITGNLTVNGTVTTINTETISLADNVIVLNGNYTGSTPTENAGIEIERGTLANASLLWNETTDKWQTSSDSITYYDIVSTANFMSANIGNGALTIIPITHNWGTKEIMVEVYDNASFDTILCDVVRTDNNTITLYFSVAPTTNAYKVLLHKIV
jgi:hypothetical protein